MVFGIVQHHAGRIDVSSELGRGTTVRLTLPATSEGDGDRSEAAVEASAQRVRILVVDDEPQLAKLLSQMLRRDGHDVSLAFSGQEAVERLEREELDLVISDLSMGGEMNGWDLADVVRQRFPALRVVLATGWGAGIDRQEARARGVWAVLAKPYRVSELRAAIAESMSA
jgi:CheY-like chemotaxis protein